MTSADLDEWTLKVPLPSGLNEDDIDRALLADWARRDAFSFEAIFPEMAAALRNGARRRGIPWYTEAPDGSQTLTVYRVLFQPGRHLRRGHPGEDHERRAAMVDMISEHTGASELRAATDVAALLATDGEHVTVATVRKSVERARCTFLRTDRAWTWWEQRHRAVGGSTPLEFHEAALAATQEVRPHLLGEKERRHADGRRLQCACPPRHALWARCPGCGVALCEFCWVNHCRHGDDDMPWAPQREGCPAKDARNRWARPRLK